MLSLFPPFYGGGEGGGEKNFSPQESWRDIQDLCVDIFLKKIWP